MIDHTAAPVVRTQAGDVRGIRRDDVATFLGIPFAAPPVGDLRLAAPQPHQPWAGVRDATAMGATPQRGQTDETIIPEYSVAGESTLNLNVFTTIDAVQPTAAARPVLVFIHGGGYAAGSIASPWYDGSAFARDGVVVVNVSYRLGFDGFGWVADAPANRAVLDWIAALEWVHTNIRAFGGDPARVTIAGQSAGAGAVLNLLAIPAAQHLFHAVWAMSPTLGAITRPQAQRFGEAVAREAHVEPSRAGWLSVTEEAMRLAAQDSIAARDLRRARATLAAGPRLGPWIDGDLIREAPLQAIARGIGADKPLVIGATDDEFTLLAQRFSALLRWVPIRLAMWIMGVPPLRSHRYLKANAAVFRDADTTAIAGRLITDAVFRRQVERVTRARAAASPTSPTWAYRWAWKSPVEHSALHCIDVPFFFHNLDAERAAPIVGDQPPHDLADAYHGAALDLLCSGEAPWTPHTRVRPAARVFDHPDEQGESLTAYEGTRPLT